MKTDFPAVSVIGAGFAGSEAALVLSSLGVKVKIFEKRPDPKMEHFSNSPNFAYPVCSNSFKSIEIKNAHGLLKAELSVMKSSLLRHAHKNRVKAGKALAVDRESFSKSVTEDVKSRKNIEIVNCEAGEKNLNPPVIIATGPFSSEKILDFIKESAKDRFYYFTDAVSPIILKSSIDTSKCFTASRYNEGMDYVNCPMSKSEFELFYEALLTAEREKFNETDREEFFSGCMPVEEIAKSGKRALVFGVMKPVGFERKYYAVVQLRNENSEGSMLNIVGFQTRLKWKEQERIVRMIPGLEKAKILRYGVMHKNPYINSPDVLKENMEFKSREGVFLAGQLTGSEGYMEAALTGIYSALSVHCMLRNRKIDLPPPNTMSGSLLRYILKTNKKINPMNANFGLINNYEKKERMNIAKNALKEIHGWYNETAH